MTRRRTPTLLTPLGARGLAAVDRIEGAGWKLGALEDGARLNALLITNAFPLAGMIARWNLLLDLLPCTEEP